MMVTAKKGEIESISTLEIGGWQKRNNFTKREGFAKSKSNLLT